MIGEQDKVKTRPAIEGELLPQAGESLRRQLDDLVLDKVLFWTMGALLMGIWAAFEWMRYWGIFPVTQQSVIVASVAAIGFFVTAAIKVPRALRLAANIKKGIRGEVHVGRYLDDVCRGMGYRVLHDVPGDGFNVDHVLIGPGGVFSLETKYRSKPAEAWARVVFDGVRLTRADGGYDEETVKQAKRNGDFVRRLLEKRLERRVYVFPVVMLPGWWVEDEGPRPRSVWVMADDALHKFLANEAKRLTGAEVAGVYETLAEYVRNKGK